MKRHLVFCIYTIFISAFLASCTEEDVSVEEDISVVMEPSQTIQFNIYGEEHTENSLDIENKTFANREVKNFISEHPNLSIYEYIDKKGHITYHLFKSIEDYDDFVLETFYSDNDLNARVSSSCYSTLYAVLYPYTNFGGRDRRVDFLITSNQQSGSGDYVYVPLNSVQDDREDEYVDFRNRTSSLTVQTPSYNNCHVVTQFQIVDVVNGVRVASFGFPLGPNRRRELPNLNLVGFGNWDNRADELRIDFYPPLTDG